MGKPGIFNFYCVLAINYLLSTIKVNKLFYLGNKLFYLRRESRREQNSMRSLITVVPRRLSKGPFDPLAGHMKQLSNMMDEGLPVDILYFDFRKAFDTVPHHRLLVKLENIGITGETLEIIKEFLSDREMRVGVGDSFSEVLNSRSTDLHILCNLVLLKIKTFPE